MMMPWIYLDHHKFPEKQCVASGSTAEALALAVYVLSMSDACLVYVLRMFYVCLVYVFCMSFVCLM